MHLGEVRVFVCPHCSCEPLELLYPQSPSFDEDMFIYLAGRDGKVYNSVFEFQRDLNMGVICSNNFFVYFKKMNYQEMEEGNV